MFGLSFPELLIVMVVALVVLGPERLPKLAKTLGKAMREVRRTTSEFKDMVEGEFHALERDVEAMPGKQEAAALPAGATAGAPLVRPAGAIPVAGATETVSPPEPVAVASEPVAVAAHPSIAAAHVALAAEPSPVAADPAASDAPTKDA